MPKSLMVGAAVVATLLAMPLVLFSALASPSKLTCPVARAGAARVVPGQTTMAPVGAVSGLTDQQTHHAATIIAEGRRRDLSAQGIVIALAVALQESRLRIYANDGLGDDLAPEQRGIAASLRIPHEAIGTDHGSLGIFQQQWPWWGSMRDLMDPATSAGLFYAALGRVPGWEAMTVSAAAQAVQRSAYPDAYADDEPLARRLLFTLTRGSLTGNLATGSLADVTISDCVAPSTGGAVVFPLPQGSGYVDQRNFGGTGTHWAGMHTGTDFSVACGTPVLAAHAGTVRIDTHQAWAGPWLVQVQTAPGALTTWYAHMQRVVVSNGQRVQPGDVLGEVGALGNATGCHLHFEVHPHGGSIYADPVDPTSWLRTHVGGSPAGGSVRVASFNVLGASHTRRGGTHPEMAPGRVRISWARQILDAHQVQIVGLQEFQRSQAQTFERQGRGTWSVSSPASSPANSIAWRASTWQLVRATTVRIPYFGGHPQPMPLVLLSSRSVARRVWVLNVHNPASTRHHPGNEHWRDIATTRELNVVRRIATEGDPVLLLGDFNERREAYCRLTATSLLLAAPGNSRGCQPPPWTGIDWIFGTRGTSFTRWTVDRGAAVNRTTDHPLVLADVNLG
jgi:endonuclease/exonuclease/phosphatase family metal-dependent hydrolase